MLRGPRDVGNGLDCHAIVMSSTPVTVAEGSAAVRPAGSVIGHAAKQAPHLVQALSISSTRVDSAYSKLVLCMSETYLKSRVAASAERDGDRRRTGGRREAVARPYSAPGAQGYRTQGPGRASAQTG